MFDALDRLIADPTARSMAINIVLLAIYVLAVHLLRRRAGLVRPSFKPQDLKFRETRVSGYSNRSVFTKAGGWRRGLVVTATKDAVFIEPALLFKWLIPPGFHDLEFHIKRSDVVSVESDVMQGRKIAKIRFRAQDQTVRTVALLLADAEAFSAVVQGEKGQRKADSG